MKKLLVFSLAIAILSCKQIKPVDYAVISGTISNPNGKILNVYSQNRNVNKKLEVDKEGKFLDTLRTDFGFYTFYDEKNHKTFYVSQGDNIIINYDANNFDETLTYLGSGNEVNNYLKAKDTENTKLISDRAALFSLDENAFKEKVLDNKTNVEKMLNSIIGISDEFRANEKKNILYEYLSNLSQYEGYHGYYTKNRDFKVGENFLHELKEVDYNNENDYKFSASYRDLVKRHYSQMAYNKTKDNDSFDRSLEYLKIYGLATNQNIKNKLAFDEANFSIKYVDDIELYYNTFMELSTDEENNKIMQETYNNLKQLSQGQPSPKFVGYDNYDGTKTSLEDLKGKYVYIDVWATWCGPCKAEIPYLKEVEEKYHGKNIHFVSISVDKQKDRDKWEAMVKEKELSGIQLFADNDFKSDFIKEYMITAIPQFMLLDPEGNIVRKNAPRPSDERLIALFESLDI